MSSEIKLITFFDIQKKDDLKVICLIDFAYVCKNIKMYGKI